MCSNYIFSILHKNNIYLEVLLCKGFLLIVFDFMTIIIYCITPTYNHYGRCCSINLEKDRKLYHYCQRNLKTLLLFISLGLKSVFALVLVVSGTVRKWGRMKSTVKPLCRNNVPFAFWEYDPILEKGLGNLLFTWQCLTWNIILTGLMLENSYACEDAQC